MSLTAAIIVGHLLGDWIVQTDHQAARKTLPGWRGIKAMAAHTTGYHLALALVLAVTGWWQWPAAGQTIAVSWLTHAVIDRRWPVRQLMIATRSDVLADTAWGVIVVDQALHMIILLACTVLWSW